MNDIKKWFVNPEHSPAFEIPATSHDEAREYVKNNFRGSGEVRIFEATFRNISTTPFLVET